MKKVIMLLDNNFKSDARVEREAISLFENGYDVEVYAEKFDDLLNYEVRNNIKIFREIDKSIHRPLSKEYNFFKEKFVDEIVKKDFSILHCHDYKMLLLGAEIKKKKNDIKLIYDSHEYLAGFPFYKEIPTLKGKVKGWFIWKYYFEQEKKSIKYADKIITISQGIAEEMRKHFDLPDAPLVLRNIPSLFALSSEKYFHKKFNISFDKKVIVSSGNLYFGEKRVKMLIDAARESENIYLLFIGSTPKHKKLKNRIESLNLSDKVFFHDYISSQEIGKLISNADIGLVHTWQPKWKSHWHSLPNRFFEYCLAGLPIVCTSQPEFVRLGNEFNNAVFYRGDKKNDLIKAIHNCLENYETLKQNALKIRENLSWEKESEKLIEIYKCNLQ
ncbi:MAG: glycosyltransferase family 4 protein [Bacteroidales bacterium]|jgi:glycosyltransferase involved in cell wall biosynthesis